MCGIWDPFFNVERDMEIGMEKIKIAVETNDVMTYALQQNGMRLIREIDLKNETEEDLENLCVKIFTQEGWIEPLEQGIDLLPAGEELRLKEFQVVISGTYLASLTERVKSILYVEIYQEDQRISAAEKEMTVLAYDEWPGLKYFPDLLAAFVTPNHPCVTQLLQSAAAWLDRWTDQTSLEGYQTGDQNRIKQMAAAAYAAIQEKNITYAVPPASFEEIGQRVRLADAVMEQRMGTCLDLTLLYAACLEAMGLNPFVVLMQGHIFAGLWLIDEAFPDPVIDDPSQIEKRMAEGVHEVMIVESTMMCTGQPSSFDDAVKAAGRTLKNYEDFLFVIDITRARKSGIRPLPIRIRTNEGFEILQEDRKEQDLTKIPEALGDTFAYELSAEQEKLTKEVQWERKLLDLSLRNMLINMRLTKGIVPLLSESLSDLEDALVEGEEFQVLSRPADWKMPEGKTFTLENTNDLGEHGEWIALECGHRRLHTIYNESELNQTLTKMYRSAKTTMEENGASTLYLAVGLVRWFEKDREKFPHYAPIVLIPIEIIRKSASKGYMLRMRDEDAQMNITLLEFLKQNFDIRIRGLDPLPMDEHGLDTRRIFAILRHGIMDEPMWDVIESGFIGNFSFSQFVMWNDLHHHKDVFHSNKIVRSLILGAMDWDCTVPEEVDQEEAYLPVAADASQLRAIHMAAADISFVLHGPPGTGKSQTITAMIANALSKGKTVLFVAEKMAALEVVQKRLTSLGIGDFCLELHSNKAVKRNVFRQLKQGLEKKDLKSVNGYEDKIRSLREARFELDTYARELHKQHKIGKSLRELIDLYVDVPDDPERISFSREFVLSLTQSDLDEHKHLLGRLIAAGRAIGHPYAHPLSEIKRYTYSQTIKIQLKDTIDRYIGSLEKLKIDMEIFFSYMGKILPRSKKEWEKARKYASGVRTLEKAPEFLWEVDSLEAEFLTADRYMEKLEAFQKKKQAFHSRWNENFLRMDMEIFKNRLEEAERKFFGRRKAVSAIITELQSYAYFKILPENIPSLLTDVVFYQKDEEEIHQIEKELSPAWQPILRDFETMKEWHSYKAGILEAFDQTADIREEFLALKKEKHTDYFDKAQEVQKAYEAMETAERKLKELLWISFRDDEENWMEGRKQSCENILRHASSIKDWIIYRKFYQDCEEAGIGAAAKAYENGLSHERLMNVYLKSIYQALIIAIIEEEPVLNGFTGAGFQEQIMQFRELEQKITKLSKKELRYELMRRLPKESESIEVNKELNLLRRAISSNGRGVSIRTLFEQIPHILTRLCPCMLMSPISVAQYLAMENDLFDIVIFDEASQLPTCKAVGVLARGKNAVIVGDPNQMPPTSFFAGNTVDEDHLEIEDLDSILDDCLALGMPQSHLKWHYRSRHESLIAFSNYEFYENSMRTFPSVNDRERRVRLIKANGYFDRGKKRINQEEANLIVQEIRKRYKDAEQKDQSVGVVTFNIQQQTLIEDLLMEEYQKDPDFDLWANTGEEPLFIKNLENVQGDERDVILFSVAFGPDQEGRFTMNFGPLNREGGWKRLNVAVTRARNEMIVFSTMTADMIDLKRTRSKGVEALAHFLSFAEHGKVYTGYDKKKTGKKKGILKKICNELETAGYDYQTSVGHSDFKVDIAVMNPYDPDEYMLGIMLDGDVYKQSKNTKDREVAQIDILRGLGWEIYRIWTMDWWDDWEKEIDKLKNYLENMRQSLAARRESEAADQGLPYESAKIETNVMTAAQFLNLKSRKAIQENIIQIVETEAPIAFSRLLRKTLRSFGIGRSGLQAIKVVEQILETLPYQADPQEDMIFYWKSEQDPKNYGGYRIDQGGAEKRLPEEICQQEIKNALCAVLKEKGRMKQDALIRETVHQMGYARSGKALANAIKRGLRFGLETGEIESQENGSFQYQRQERNVE